MKAISMLVSSIQPIISYGLGQGRRKVPVAYFKLQVRQGAICVAERRFSLLTLETNKTVGLPVSKKVLCHMAADQVTAWAYCPIMHVSTANGLQGGEIHNQRSLRFRRIKNKKRPPDGEAADVDEHSFCSAILCTIRQQELRTCITIRHKRLESQTFCILITTSKREKLLLHQRFPVHGLAGTSIAAQRKCLTGFSIENLSSRLAKPGPANFGENTLHEGRRRFIAPDGS
jgi:hypothetical protein